MTTKQSNVGKPMFQFLFYCRNQKNEYNKEWNCLSQGTYFDEKRRDKEAKEKMTFAMNGGPTVPDIIGKSPKDGTEFKLVKRQLQVISETEEVRVRK